MSGLLALLDDVAGIAKVAASSVDDIVAQATKAGAKAAGAVIDDAAVTPKYVQGFHPNRELPIIWRIAVGSIRNKLLILLPAALLLSAFAPWAITPLLMIGGLYLCYEGAEKVIHVLAPKTQAALVPATGAPDDPSHLEEEKVAGAIKTDFVLSAEIMTIALSSLTMPNLWMQAFALFVVAVGITVLVYGAVAVIVKADDVGLMMAQKGHLGFVRATGRAIVQGMPGFLKLLTIVGTAAMLWVGGSIILHGAADLGWGGLAHWIKDIAHHAEALAHGTKLGGFLSWSTTALLDGLFGLAIGAASVPILGRFLH